MGSQAEPELTFLMVLNVLVPLCISLANSRVELEFPIWRGHIINMKNLGCYLSEKLHFKPY